ncbi:MAG: Type 1 glutamine amidotransferase-like domain-containing protein [Candidatus Colwellbacteria bacterium]|nr:Type 1 glutamine amidotransferase-like domain-containing protein [Candidatus Colwellbacteria bacterium]
MKILLTSTGLSNNKIRDFFISRIDNLKEKTAVVVAAGRTPEEQGYIEASKKELIDLGIKVTEANISEMDSFPEDDFDIYYVCGGNTFYILDRMRKTGAYKALAGAIRKGKFYIGVSAGSIVPCRNIRIAGVGADGDENEVGLSDLSGFRILPFYVFPHYSDSNEAEVRDFKGRGDDEVIGLTNDQAIFVSDNECLIIGNKGGLNLGLKAGDLTS